MSDAHAAAKIRAKAIGANYTQAPSADAVEWQLRGLCATSQEPDLWSAVPVHQVRQAKEICEHCPVMIKCRRWALNTHQEHGVWGGLSEIDRQYMWGERRSRRGAA